MGEVQVHSCGTRLCSLDAKWSKDKERRRLCSKRGFKAPCQNTPARALVPAWRVGYLRKLSVTRNPWDLAVELSHHKCKLLLLRDTGRAARSPTHMEGHSMGPSKICHLGVASISAADSAGAFLLLCAKTKR